MKSHRAMRAVTDDQLRRWRDDLAAQLGGLSRSTRREVGQRAIERTLAEVDGEISKRVR